MGGGISVTQIPMHIDKETFRKITGGTFNDPIFDDHCVDGVMSRDKLLALSQTTDCFLSFDRQQQDCHGRNNMTRAQRIQNSLRSRGIVCWLLEEQVPGCSSDSAGAVFNANKNNITHICKGIDNTRCVICLVTNHYVTRVFQSSNTTDQCQIEFNYAVRQRFPSHMIGAICEQPLLNDACAWRGPVGKYLLKDGGAASTAASSRNGSRANSARGSSNIFGEAPTTISCTPIPSWSPNTLDMTSDDPSIFEAQIDALFRRVVEITRAKHVREYFEVPEPIPVPIQVSKPQPQFHKVHVPLPQSQGLPPHATREDAQFMQWMARCCPEISLEKRVVYCAAFEHRGVKTVHQLAECMRDETNYLMSAGVSERDADDIALAVSDLGLGYVPVRDFSNASTIESAVYAMRKSCEAAGDSELGANALACIARIARGDPENAPLALAAAGCVEPVVKILSRNLGFATCVANAYLALQGLSVNEEIAAKLGDVSACDVVPRALQSHLTNEVVVEQGCKLISMLAGNMENNFKLGTAGACDVVMKGLLKHINHPGVARWGCDAANKLAIGNFENVGKLSYHNACEALSTAVAVHFQVADVAEHAFRAMNILAVEPENRARMGKLGACEGTLNALNFHMNNPIIVEYALRLITVLIVGNSNNRNALGRLGATTLIFNVFSTYTSLKHRSQLKVKQTKQAPNNAIFGGSASASMQAVESPYVFDFPEIIEYASRATYSLAAGSPDNQRALMPVLPFLQDITRVANAYVEVANAVEMQTTGKRSAGNAHTNIVVPGKEEMLLSAETQAMRRIKNEATEGFQRVGSS